MTHQWPRAPGTGQTELRGLEQAYTTHRMHDLSQMAHQNQDKMERAMELLKDIIRDRMTRDGYVFLHYLANHPGLNVGSAIALK